jgi:SEC-C motif domain protein
MNCYCGASIPYPDCCQPYIIGTKKATSAETLMRSRYAAYCIQDANYLIATTHNSTIQLHNKEDTLSFAQQNQWIKLEIINAQETTVEFKAYYLDSNLKAQIHHEKSTFKEEDGVWYYVDGEWF